MYQKTPPSLVLLYHHREEAPFPAPNTHNRELRDKNSHFLSTYYVPGMLYAGSLPIFSTTL